MGLNGRQIRIVGGGVAGLAAARALARRGATVSLMEQAPEITEVGAGIQISPNGLRVIEALGLGEALRNASLTANAVTLRDGKSGHAVLRLDLAKLPVGYKLIHRARLIKILEAGAREAGAEITLGASGAPGGPGDAVLEIGADGWRSAYRTALNGREIPFFTGQVAWRALIPDEAPPEVEVFMGPGRHLVSYPLPDGLRNIVAVEERSAWAEEGWTHEDDPAALRAAFSGFGGPVSDWLARVEQVHLWGLFRHPVAARWQNGEMAILGDAAHPTLPFLAQGANLALEDAYVLAACLDAVPQAAALARYQALRRDRSVRVVDAATANARNYHLRPPLSHAAHAALRLAGRVAPGAALARFDWLYGYDATQQA